MIIGIDLHGTLLGKNWFIAENLVEPLNETLARLNGKTKIYTCTGNDLSFTRAHIPSSIRKYFSGRMWQWISFHLATVNIPG